MSDQLIDIQNELGSVKDLIEVAFMASSDLNPEQIDPMKTLFVVTSKRLEGAIEALEKFRTRNRKETADV